MNAHIQLEYPGGGLCAPLNVHTRVGNPGLHPAKSLQSMPPDVRRRAKAINVQLSMPNTSNLKNLCDADRTLVEHYLEVWALIEAAA